MEFGSTIYIFHNNHIGFAKRMCDVRMKDTALNICIYSNCFFFQTIYARHRPSRDG